MNILFISDKTPLGGASKALVMLTKILEENDCKIIVCVCKTPNLEKKLGDIGIQTIETKHIPVMVNTPRKTYKRIAKKIILFLVRFLFLNRMAVKRVERAIDLSTVDIIHTNSARSDLGCLIAKKYSIPHIVHLREFGIEDFDCMLLENDYFSCLNKSTDAFIAVSDAVKKSWIKKGINGNKISTIYDGVNVNEIKPKKTYNSENIKIVIVGGVLQTKGQHICIKAIRALPKSIREKVTLDIIGWEDAGYRKYLDKLIKRFGLQNTVSFLGIKDNIGSILCNYDIGIMASKSEGFGLVTAEYMAAGLCVIASNSGANPELISDRENGLLFDRENYKDLAKHIRNLYNDRSLMKELATAGKKKAEKNYTIMRNAENIIDLYNKTIRNDIGGIHGFGYNSNLQS